MKYCIKCETSKEFTAFNLDKNSKDGYAFYCKACRKIIRKENKDTTDIYNLNHYHSNPELHKARALKYYKNNKRKTNIRNAQYYKTRRKNDIEFKIRTNLRNRINRAIKYDWTSGSAVRDLGCSIAELRIYLESKFQTDMTWENYGQFGWHIDHIIPLASFDLTKREEFLKACNYNNLQPLWWHENLSKNYKCEK